MLYAITPENMRKLEQAFMEETGYPSLLLMEHAAQAVVSHLGTGHVLFLCGPGQNGGDGYAAARLYKGPKTIWQFSPEMLTGNAKLNAALLAKVCPEANIIRVGDRLPAIPNDVEWVVDALYGTGLSHAIEWGEADAVKAINASGRKILACDVPSGINSLTGDKSGHAVRATVTVTFHQPKVGLYLKHGIEHSGTIHIADIGIPHIEQDFSILEPGDLPALRLPRRKNTYKGIYGRVLIIAGSMGMAGAAAICASAAIQTGAGLTTIACDENIMPILQTLVPCAMCVPMSAVEEAIERTEVIAIGPGLGTSSERLPIIKAVLQAGKPTVWDADGLNLLAAHPELKPIGQQNIFTPHPGEAARFDCKDLQAHLGGTVVLKGATTIITNGQRTALNITGTPAMAKGGSGDALTGIIVGLLGQMPGKPFLSAQLGCLIHGMAGCAAEMETGENGLDALKLIHKIY